MDPWAFIGSDLDFEYVNEEEHPSEMSEMYPDGQWYISYVGCKNCYILFNKKKYKIVEYNNEVKQLRFITEENIEETTTGELKFNETDIYSVAIVPV